MDPISSPSESQLNILPLEPLESPFLTYRLPEGRERPGSGTRVIVPLGRRLVTGLVWPASGPPWEGETREIADLPDPRPVLPPFLFSLLEFGSWYYRVPLGALVRSALPPSLSATRALSSRFWKEWEKERPSFLSPLPSLPPLSPDQLRAFEEWDQVRSRGGFSPFLLEGITGSGKTRLYQEMARKVIEEGKRVLLLTPEIGLVGPLLSSMEQISPDTVSLHSRQTPAARARGWARILSGNASVVVGPRSALFAPLPDLGLVIVDEEHDPSYQAYEGLSFNARNLAIKRAQEADVPVVLGSATPLSDSLFHAGAGRYYPLRLPRRIGGFSLPPIELVVPSIGPSPLPDEVREALAKTLSRHEQAVILLNRRGYVPTLLCRDCHTHVTCPSCAVRLVLHKVPERRMICHFCAASYAVPSLCPSCRGRNLDLRGIATQRLEEELRSFFPETRILRLDQDQKEDAWEKIGRFREGEGEILIGTQVVAKGHDLPGVTLGVVLEADGMLAFPDYRASERAFGLWIQLAGRVGRHRTGGRVMLVTREPENPIFGWAKNYDTRSFHEGLLEERKLLGYPPYCRLASIILSSASEDVIREVLSEPSPFGSHPPGNGIYGPIPALPPRLKNRYRAQILIKAPTVREVHERLSLIRHHYRPGKKILVEWQIDPSDLA